MDQPSSGQVRMLVTDVKDTSAEAGDNGRGAAAVLRERDPGELHRRAQHPSDRYRRPGMAHGALACDRGTPLLSPPGYNAGQEIVRALAASARSGSGRGASAGGGRPSGGRRPRAGGPCEIHGQYRSGQYRGS